MRQYPNQTVAASEHDNSGFATAYAGLIALAVAIGIGRFAFTPLLPMMQEDAGLSVIAGGWLASANYFGYLLGALSAMGMRTRATSVIRGGFVMIGLTTLGMGFTNDFIVWLILRTLAGIMSAWVLIHVSAWCLEKLSPLGRPVLNGIVFAGVGSGISVAGGLCLVLMKVQASSAQTWMVLGVISLLLALIIWHSFAANDGVLPRLGKRPVATKFSCNSETIRLICCYGAFGFGYIIPATFLPLMARQLIQDPAIFGWSWPVFGIAALGSTLAVAVLPRLITHRRIWIMSHLLMALGVALPVFWPSIGGIMLAALLVGGTFVVITMVSIQEARTVAGHQATGLIAAMTAAFAAGQIIGPISASYLVEVNGNFSVALLVASSFLTISAYALYRLKPNAG